ncbi:cysteine-rich secretory protein 3-like [Orycteropus afer afer]|uniref:Cysteine-rich secretory protein 3-like n=1 Tax=Orycteropus afer afer TaxID=1230840 RepID=A0A8B6ZF88_ORYAF|nr:cysteine-rich secretory protein 3-like [Orycteropus afer afer]
MTLLSVVLFLTAVLLPSFPANGQDPGFAALSTTLQQVQTEIVNKHNDLRRNVSPQASDMLKMMWDSEAQVNAQNWANKCNYHHSQEEDRRTNIKCGENLFMSSVPTSWSNAIQSWTAEAHDFVFGVGAKNPDAPIGHFTQAVWATSFRVGCGISYCPSQGTLAYFYVCQYCPVGNHVTRQYSPYKPGPPCSSCPGYCDNKLCTNSCNYEDGYGNCPDLKKMVTCEHEVVKSSCQASCNCEGKIY